MKGYLADIEALTEENTAFRHVLLHRPPSATGAHGADP